MKVIIYRYGSICEPDIIEAFTHYGIIVIEETTEIRSKCIEPEKRISLLADLINAHSPFFIFSINYFPHIAKTCERFKILYVSFSVDCPVLELFSSSIRSPYNRIFLFDYSQYLKFKDENPDYIYHLPLAANSERWSEVFSSAFESDFHKYACDISFVGSLYTEKSPLPNISLTPLYRGFADGLIESQLKITGCNLFEDAVTTDFISAVKAASSSFYQIPDSYVNTDAYVTAHYYLSMHASHLERIRILNELAGEFPVNLYTRSDTSPLTNVHCHNGVSTHTEMPLVFRFSKINLNITMRSIQSGLSLRVWDILGCGGFLLTNYQSELENFFEFGTDLDCYETVSELKEKIKYYLENDEVRMEIAANGYKKVQKLHQWKNRIYQILKILESSLTNK